jgi:hypothetical protein
VEWDGDRVRSERARQDVTFTAQAWSLRFGCQPGGPPQWTLVEDGRARRTFGLPEMTYADLMTRISPPAPFPVARLLAHDAVAALGESPRRTVPGAGDGG